MKDVLSATTSSAGMAHCVCVRVGGAAGRHQDFWDLFAYKKYATRPFRDLSFDPAILQICRQLKTDITQ